MGASRLNPDHAPPLAPLMVSKESFLSLLSDERAQVPRAGRPKSLPPQLSACSFRLTCRFFDPPNVWQGVWINAGPNVESSREGRLQSATVRNYYQLAQSLRDSMGESDKDKLVNYRSQIRQRRAAETKGAAGR